MADDKLDDETEAGNWDDKLAAVIDSLIDMANGSEASIADVEGMLDLATEGNIEKMLLATAIVFIGIGCVSERRCGRNAFELLDEMRTSLEAKGGKWN